MCSSAFFGVTGEADTLTGEVELISTTSTFCIDEVTETEDAHVTAVVTTSAGAAGTTGDTCITEVGILTAIAGLSKGDALETGVAVGEGEADTLISWAEEVAVILAFIVVFGRALEVFDKGGIFILADMIFGWIFAVIGGARVTDGRITFPVVLCNIH